MRSFKCIVAVACGLLLSACKTFSPDGGMGLVSAATEEAIQKDVVAVRGADDERRAREVVDRLLRRPLSAEAAVQIALLNNRGLQAAFSELASAEAQMVESSLPPSPTVSLLRLASSAELEIERKIVADILALATLPARADIAADRFLQAQYRAIAETLRVATEARRAYYRAVAARESAGALAQAKLAAGAASELAGKLGATGAMNKLDQAREHVFYAEVSAQSATAQQRIMSERERLIRALGLWGSDLGFRLPNALPVLPPRIQALPSVEVEAVRRRVDVRIARIELDFMAKSASLTQATRFLNLLELAGISKTTREAGSSPVRAQGVEAEFQIPLFDFGEARVRQAEEKYRGALHRLAEKAVNARSEAREAYAAYRSSYEVAVHYQREILPLRKIIAEETQLRYGAMQIDDFALLIEARQRLAAIGVAIEAKRDFWLRKTDVLNAVLGGAPAASNEAPAPMSAPESRAGGR